MDSALNINYTHKDHSYLINKKVLKLIYRQITFTIIFFIFIFVFIYVVFTSSANLIMVFGLNISLYYLPPLILCCLIFISSVYRLHFVISKRLIKGIYVGSSIQLKLFNNEMVELHSFELIYDQNKINYVNRGGMGDKVFEKYNYQYIGIRDNKMIYLLPYKEESKEFTINLLQDVSMQSHKNSH